MQNGYYIGILTWIVLITNVHVNLSFNSSSTIYLLFWSYINYLTSLILSYLICEKKGGDKNSIYLMGLFYRLNGIMYKSLYIALGNGKDNKLKLIIITVCDYILICETMSIKNRQTCEQRSWKERSAWL